jgi:hypothetical protein
MSEKEEKYSAFEGVNLNGARGENESFEDYKSRRKFNKKVLKLYKELGPKQFEAMFPGGAAELFNQVKNLDNYDEVQNEL